MQVVGGNDPPEVGEQRPTPSGEVVGNKPTATRSRNALAHRTPSPQTHLPACATALPTVLHNKQPAKPNQPRPVPPAPPRTCQRWSGTPPGRGSSSRRVTWSRCRQRSSHCSSGGTVTQTVETGAGEGGPQRVQSAHSRPRSSWCSARGVQPKRRNVQRPGTEGGWRVPSSGCCPRSSPSRECGAAAICSSRLPTPVASVPDGRAGLHLLPLRRQLDGCDVRLGVQDQQGQV